LGCVIFFILWIAISLPKTYNGYVEADFYDFWAGGRAIVEGRNPYNPADWKAIRSAFEGDWVANSFSVYPLLTNLLFAPLSLLPLSIAASVWLILSQFMVLGSVLLCITSADFEGWRRYLIFILIGVILFRPTIVTVRNGQLGGFLLLLLSLSIWLWKRGHWFLGGLTLGFFATKPSLAVPFFLVFGIWFLIKRRWNVIGGMVISVVLLFVSFLIFDIDWFFAWLASGSNKLVLMEPYVPSIWGLVASLTGRSYHWFVYGAMITLLILSVTFLSLYRKRGLDEFLLVIFLIPITILLAPYIWNYDQIYLIVPLVFTLSVLDRLNVPFVVNGSFLIWFDLLSVLLVLLAIMVGHDGWGTLLSLFTLLTSYLVWREIQRRGLEGEFMLQPNSRIVG
jgi:hypothetical protein